MIASDLLDKEDVYQECRLYGVCFEILFRLVGFGLEKCLLDSSYPSARLSVRVYHRGSHWTDFPEI
jgi:hypothetical protein